MQRIYLRSYGATSDVEAFTDCYVAKYGKVMFLSLVGNHSAVSAFASTILAKEKEKSLAGLHTEDRTYLTRAPGAHYKCTTGKLSPQLTHLIIADSRLYEPDKNEWWVLIPHSVVRSGNGPVETMQWNKAFPIIYDKVLRNIPSPTLPEWTKEICQRLMNQQRFQQFKGYEGLIAQLTVDESILDSVVSQGVKEGKLTWSH